jgi:hypothetical protein
MAYDAIFSSFIPPEISICTFSPNPIFLRVVRVDLTVSGVILSRRRISAPARAAATAS